MSRTKGSGWGGGPILYQRCPHCGKKRVMYDPVSELPPFKCTACKRRFYSDSLIHRKYVGRSPEDVLMIIVRVGFLGQSAKLKEAVKDFISNFPEHKLTKPFSAWLDEL